MQQLGVTATPDEIAAHENTFETHLAESGLVLVVTQPRVTGAAGTMSAVALDAEVSVAICENPEVNRRATGLQKVGAIVADELILALLDPPRVSFDQQPVINPVLIDGMVVSFARPIVRCVLRKPTS